MTCRPPDTDGESSTGIVLYFHGGRFSLGSRAKIRCVGQAAGDQTGADVVSVEYRLAPEHTFPRPPTTRWTRYWRHVVDAAPHWCAPTRSWSPATCRASQPAAAGPGCVRGEAVQPAPGFIADLPGDRLPRSVAHGVSARVRRGCLPEHRTHRLVPADARVPNVPDRSHPVRRRSWPTICQVCRPPTCWSPGFDPLRDEGIACADRLRAAGVPVTSTAPAADPRFRQYDRPLFGTGPAPPPTASPPPSAPRSNQTFLIPEAGVTRVTPHLDP